MKDKKQQTGSWIQSLPDKLYRVELIFMCAFTLYIAFDVVLGIVLRILDMQTLKFSEELGRVMLITTTMVGSSMAVRTDGHMAMDTIYHFVSEKTGQYIKTVVYILCSVFWILMSYFGLQFTIKLFQIQKTMESLPICRGYIWIFVTYGMFTMGIRYFVQFGLSIKRILNGFRAPESTGDDKNDAAGGDSLC